MKCLSAAAFATALTVLSIPMAVAVEPAQAAGTEQRASSEHREDHGQRRAEYAKKNLDALQSQLHLRDNQQAGWAQYKSVVLNALSDFEKGREGRRAHNAEAREVASTPARIQTMVARMRERADKLEKLGKQTEVLYKTLTPEQQTIFDLHWQNRHAHQHRS